MKITYANKKIERCFSDSSVMQQRIGFELTRSVKKRMDHLMAAETFGDFLSRGLGHPKQLGGYEQIKFSARVSPNARLIIEPSAAQDTLMICSEVEIEGVIIMAAKIIGTSRDLLVHPGETIADILLERGISQAALAASTDVSPAFVSSVISGKKAISASFAMALEYALDIPKSFWLNLQANYDAELLEISMSESVTDEERAAFKKIAEVVSYLKETGSVNSGLSVEATIHAVRKSLRISNIANLGKLVPRGAFRMSGTQRIDPLVLGAWLRICQTANEGITVSQSFNSQDTQKLITELKALMLSCPVDNLQESLRGLLARYGIAFSIVKHFTGAPIHGYVAKRDNGAFQMAVTIGNAWEDVFWFSLFHEIGHIHNGDVSSKRKEFVDTGNEGDIELRADAFARDALIDPTAFDAFLSNEVFTEQSIEQFSKEQRIKPCIVVGRLQKEEIIPWNHLTNLKLLLKWA